MNQSVQRASTAHPRVRNARGWHVFCERAFCPPRSVADRQVSAKRSKAEGCLRGRLRGGAGSAAAGPPTWIARPRAHRAHRATARIRGASCHSGAPVGGTRSVISSCTGGVACVAWRAPPKRSRAQMAEQARAVTTARPLHSQHLIASPEVAAQAGRRPAGRALPRRDAISLPAAPRARTGTRRARVALTDLVSRAVPYFDGTPRVSDRCSYPVRRCRSGQPCLRFQAKRAVRR